MKIASINPESTIDYPGKYGPIIFTAGCNFNCGFCHNPELSSGENKLISQERLDDFLKNFKIKAHRGWYTGICISGGEPTIQEDLPEFIRKIRQEGLAVKLDTNGSNPKMLKKLLEDNLVDYIAMDVKGPKNLYAKITNNNVNVDDVESSMRIVSRFPDYEFRTTVVPIIGYNGDGIEFMKPNDTEEMAKWVVVCTGKNDSKLYLQSFVARPLGGIMDDRLCKDNLPEKMHHTPVGLLDEMCTIIKKYLPNSKIR